MRRVRFPSQHVQVCRQTPDRIPGSHAPDRTVNVRPDVCKMKVAHTNVTHNQGENSPTFTGRERDVPVDVSPLARRRTHRRRRGGRRGEGRRREPRTWLRSINCGGGTCFHPLMVLVQVQVQVQLQVQVQVQLDSTLRFLSEATGREMTSSGGAFKIKRKLQQN